MGNLNERQFDYRGEHGAPGPEDAPLHDLTQGGVYPHDVYTHLHQYDWEAREHPETTGKIYGARGRPNKVTRIYRAVPDTSHGINTGDWVTLSRKYAKQHARMDENPANDMKVITRIVSAKHLFTNGDSLQEWGYHGPPLKGRKSPQRTETPPVRQQAPGGREWGSSIH